MSKFNVMTINKKCSYYQPHSKNKRLIILIQFIFLSTIPIHLFKFVDASYSSTNNINKNQPNIIFILADDLGWNDVGFHGSSQLPTPNIDALAYTGLILNRYYVTPICTPSRSALMTGKYPIHTGMQHTVLYGGEPRGLPLREKILPQYLKELGYMNHIVGKWHLGHYKREYTPLYRGFDSHIGYWTGHQDYFDHTAMENHCWGLDMRDGLDVAYDLHGQYTTDIISRESVKIIQNHNLSQPLFLYMAHAAVHSGNPYNPLPAPDATVAKITNISDYNRRRFAAMITHLDDSVGAVVAELDKKNMLENSIIIFSTDNGGPAEGFNINAASNWPLRGVKNTLWEGGVRGAALLWSPLLQKSGGRIANQTMHISDWLPTLYSAAGGDIKNLGDKLDGKDLWDALSMDTVSERNEILHNIDDLYGNAALTIADWKVIKGTSYNGQWDGWYGPAGDHNFASYNLTAVMESESGRSLSRMKMIPSVERIRELRDQSNVNCLTAIYTNITTFEQCKPLIKPCLFNIADDPCEKFNLADKFPILLQSLLDSLEQYNKSSVPPGNLPLDSRGNPKFWEYTWTNFGDYSSIKNIDL